MSYFFHGTSSRNPTTGLLEQYGLFNFVIGRFVIVHHDRRVLNIVQKLFSSRYQLILCSLHHSSNFHENLIDNSVCYNWGVGDISIMRATRFPKFDTDPILCKELVEYSAIDPREQIWADKEYLWYACSYASLFVNKKPWLGTYHGFIAEELPDYAHASLFAVDLPKTLVDFRREIYSVIYQTFDFEEAKSRIQLISQHYQTTHGHRIIPEVDLSID